MTVQAIDRKKFLLPWLVGLALAVGTCACYWQVRHFDYVTLDDPAYVYDARMVEDGLTWRGFLWAFGNTFNGNWNPLVWLSHMADTQVFGMGAGGHHLTNVALHVANVLLLFVVLKTMTGAIWRSAFVAAIFAWHPMHVESVAWISERKDVLSTLFWLLTMLAYARYARGFRISAARYKMWYGLTLLFFALGLMCKSMLVTLPFVLLLMDCWPLQREQLGWRWLAGWEKTPFYVLSLAASVLAVYAQNSVGALGSTPFGIRMGNALLAYAEYAGKFFRPTNLTMFYPYPHTIAPGKLILSLAVLSGISGIAIWRFKKWKYLAMGWFWFLGTLVPVIGLVQIGLQGMADRYTYVPYIGLAIMLSWGMADLVFARPKIKFPAIAAGAAGLICFLNLTHAQVGYWRNSTALYDHALKVNPDDYVTHIKRGELFTQNGKLDEARDEFEKVLPFLPTSGKVYMNLGIVYGTQNKTDEAIAMFNKAISLTPNLSQAHVNLGYTYLIEHKTAAGIAELELAFKINPDDPVGCEKLVNALLDQGRAAEALPYCEALVRDDPEDPRAYFELGHACLATHHEREAIPAFKEAIRLAPQAQAPLNALAWTYATNPNAEFRNGAEAVTLARRAVEISKHGRTDILDTLAAAYAETGQFADAIKINDEMRALAEKSTNAPMLEMARQRAQLYLAGKPVREN